jgi:hypothetical protein
MPLTEKGEKIASAMKSKYGEKKGKEVFYASKNAGKITGVDDDAQHMGLTGEGATSIKQLVTECDALEKRMDFFEKRFAMRHTSKVKPRTKDFMQPSQPRPKEVK